MLHSLAEQLLIFAKPHNHLYTYFDRTRIFDSNFSSVRNFCPVQEFGNIESPMYSRLRHFFSTIYGRLALLEFVLHMEYFEDFWLFLCLSLLVFYIIELCSTCQYAGFSIEKV